MGKKSELDKFYTNPKIVPSLLEYLDLTGYNLIIEPSAGNGSFYHHLPSDRSLGLDISPEADDIEYQDWLSYQIPESFESVLVVGNPPFGERNHLSKSFIEHAIGFNNVNTIAFILPNVFNKHTNQKIFPREWRLAKVIKLPDNSFLVDGKPYHVPCSFFIWTKISGMIDLRFKEELYKSHPDFTFSNEDDFDIFVMGASPATIKHKGEISKNNRGYYLKSNIGIEKLKRNIQGIRWNQHGQSSAGGGVAWFTKSEFIKTYDENKPI